MEGQVGTSPPLPRQAPKVVNRCDRCFAELYETERAPGSTSLACPNHGYDRIILTIPVDLEEWAARRPEVAGRYALWLMNGRPVQGLAPGPLRRLLDWLGLR